MPATRLAAFALAAAVTVGGAGEGWAAEKPPADLYRQWRATNEDCRGGAGDDATTMTACEYRNVIDRKMAAAGWCYTGSPLDWRRCRH